MTHPYANNALTRIKLPPAPDKWTPDPVQVLDAQALQPPRRHPVGLNVRQDVNYADVLAYVKQMGGVRTMLFHCDRSVLPKLKPFLEWCDALTWRPRPNSGETWTSETLYQHFDATAFVSRCYGDMMTAGISPLQVWLHLHNEAGWNPQMIAWEVEAIEHAIDEDMRIVALSPAVGTPEQTAIPMARAIIELAGKYPDQVLIGLHEYFSIYGTRKDPWYLERWQFWEDYRIAEGLPGVRYVVTEFGSEDIADDHGFTNTLPRTNGRPHVGPVKANDRAWANTYHIPAINFHPRQYTGIDSAYAEQITTAIDVGQYLDPRIVGLCLFTWGNREDRWVDYDVSDMTAMHALLAKWWKDELVTVPPVIPPPVEVAWIEATLEAGTRPDGEPGSIFVRNPPGAAEWVAIVMDGDPISYKLEPVKNAKNLKWLNVRTKDNVEGWMALVMPGATPTKPESQFVPKVVIPPDPDDTQENPAVKLATVDYVDQKIEDSTEYTAAKLEALTARILELEQILRDVVHDYGAGHVAALKRVEKLPKQELKEIA